jgi:hypothetical protein
MSLQIDQIRCDGGTQSRAAINEATVAEYAEAMADPVTVFPPVTVYFDGRDYWLADGFHRVEAWRRIGRTDIPAEIKQGDRRSAILHSVAANSAHGLRRTNDDKRRAVLTLLEDAEWSAWSNMEIARRCAVSESLVRGLRNGHFVQNEVTLERTYTTKHGTEAVMSTARIGAAAGYEQKADPAPAIENKGKIEELPQTQIQPLRGEQDETPAAEPLDPAEAKERRELARLTTEALIDEVIGLRRSLREERVKRRGAEAEVEDLKAQIAAFEDQTEIGAKLGTALREVTKERGRLKETQVQLARETRRANAMQKERDALQARLEGQIIPMAS